jgi:hypothetical protein
MVRVLIWRTFLDLRNTDWDEGVGMDAFAVVRMYSFEDLQSMNLGTVWDENEC